MNTSSRSIGHFPGSFFSRTERILVDDNGFHYRIRKGVSIGPFATESDARSDLERFINQVANQTKLIQTHRSTSQPT